MRSRLKRLAGPFSCVLLTLLIGLCVGLIIRGRAGQSAMAKDLYARFLARDPASYTLDGRLDIRMSMTGGDDAVISGIPVTVSVGFSDTIVDHAVQGSTSMRLSVLDLADGYDLENYVSYDSDDASFLTYSRARTGDGEWGDWSVQDGYMLTLDSRALFRGAYLLDESAVAENGVYKLSARPNEVWEAVGLDGLIESVTETEQLNRTAYLAAVASSTAVYEISASTGYVTAVDADGFVMDVDGTTVRATFRVEFTDYGVDADVAVPESVLASAVFTSEGPGMSLLNLPDGKTETVTDVTTEDVDSESWEDQFSGDYGFDVVKYDDGTWHVLDMDGNEIEGAEVYDDGSVYHPEYGRIYPDYETDNG